MDLNVYTARGDTRLMLLDCLVREFDELCIDARNIQRPLVIFADVVQYRQQLEAILARLNDVSRSITEALEYENLVLVNGFWETPDTVAVSSVENYGGTD